MEIVEAVRRLYQRARADELRPEDVISLDQSSVSDTSDFLERIYFDREMFDRHMGGFASTYSVFRAFQSEETVLDVGAHWGYSVVAMRHCGCKSKIISIEALAANSPSLRRLKSIEGENYDFYRTAASDNDGVLRLFVPVVNGRAITGLATSGGTLQDSFAQLLIDLAAKENPWKSNDYDVRLAVVHVPAMRIDRIASKLGQVAAIKMDIEGHEAFALRGARNVLSNQRPLLMIEGGNRSGEVAAQMVDHGYVYCEQHNERLVRHDQKSRAVNGYWLHTEKMQVYRDLGIYDPAFT